MKKLVKLSLILSLSFSLMGCSAGGAKTEDITDQTLINEMNQTISQNIQTYFNTTVPSDITYEYRALKRFIPDTENPKDQVHQANIFQAAYKVKEPTEGTLLGYGGILTPDNSNITGLILNIAPASDAKPQKLAEADLIATGVSFLKDHGLVKDSEEPTFLEINKKASSSAVSILNFETSTHMYAVGIDLYSALPVYFEFITK